MKPAAIADCVMSAVTGAFQREMASSYLAQLFVHKRNELVIDALVSLSEFIQQQRDLAIRFGLAHCFSVVYRFQLMCGQKPNYILDRQELGEDSPSAHANSATVGWEDGKTELAIA